MKHAIKPHLLMKDKNWLRWDCSELEQENEGSRFVGANHERSKQLLKWVIYRKGRNPELRDLIVLYNSQRKDMYLASERAETRQSQLKMFIIYSGTWL